jgi:16S rRNA (guanine527-N7)-methyltransferase
MSDVPREFLDELSALRIELDPGELDRLSRFIDVLLATNERMNLTAIRDRSAAWHRHVLDSLSLLPHLQEAGVTRVLDLGSGGGLPGLPLAITMPNVEFLLLEATTKKADYLTETAGVLGCTNVSVLDERAEIVGEPGCLHREAYDAVTARAVGPMPVLLELTVPLVKPGGVVLAIKGERAEDEIKAARQAMRVLDCEVVDRCRTTTGTIVIIRKNGETSPDYPRRPGEPKRSPIGSPAPRKKR